MTDHNLQLNFNPPFDNCFGDVPVAATWSDSPPHSDLRVIAHNTGTEEINVVLEFAFQQYETGYFNPGETRELAVNLPFISGSGVIQGKLTRWRPGLFKVKGNGGGEIAFGCPFEAQRALIELDVAK